jgi:hypothetical protein
LFCRESPECGLTVKSHRRQKGRAAPNRWDIFENPIGNVEEASRTTKVRLPTLSVGVLVVFLRRHGCFAYIAMRADAIAIALPRHERCTV